MRPGHSLWLALILARGLVSAAPGAEPAHGPLRHEAYVWQRSWNAAVKESVAAHGGSFSGLAVLVAEVSWKAEHPISERFVPDYPVLARFGRPIGLVIRIGPFSGPFLPDDAPARFLRQLSRACVTEAQDRGVKVAELELDFDCAESKLGGYRIWVEALRQELTPLPLTITALPSWLNQPSFTDLANAADSLVLQVHSLERPRDISVPFSLCDTSAAMKAVEKAASLQRPFRVALPTYGYEIAFSSSGKFAGLAAEGTARKWPEGTQIRVVRADPVQVASLVQAWTTNRPPNLAGVIWYRFPIAADILNWRWPTLDAIIQARTPKESLRAVSRRVEPGLVEISLENGGELDISSRLAVEVRWSRGNGTRLLAADGLRGFQIADLNKNPFALQLINESQPVRLPAGESQVIGWLRFQDNREVKVEFKKL